MSADEFDIIARLFAPLAASAGARALIDDVAVLESKARIVLTTDAIVEGVHFLANDPIDTVAKKALRVNISDLVAKGVKPIAALLTLVWPDARQGAEIVQFARGLDQDLRRYEIALLGGDTTATLGPLIVSMTLLGEPLGERIPSRADAKPGEEVWVTGVIGDAYLGLRSLTRQPEIIAAAPADRVDAHTIALRAAYRTPEPPAAFAAAIARLASASMDVSDGLWADAQKMATASGVGMRLDAEAIPLSAAGHAYLGQAHAGLAELVSGGDDYQALFTAARALRGEIQAAARAAGVNVALIGDVEAGAGVRLLTRSGAEIGGGAGGHRHRLGR